MNRTTSSHPAGKTLAAEDVVRSTEDYTESTESHLGQVGTHACEDENDPPLLAILLRKAVSDLAQAQVRQEHATATPDAERMDSAMENLSRYRKRISQILRVGI